MQYKQKMWKHCSLYFNFENGNTIENILINK